jgi:hypothetical protein
MLSRVALSVSVVLGLVVPASGQGFKPRRAPVAPVPGVQLVPVQLEGTVAGVRLGMIAMTTAAGETWGVRIPPKVEVRVTGTAEPEVLSPGMYVRFIAPVDKRRSLVQGPVEKLVIFSPSHEVGRMPGVFYPGQEGADDSGLQPDGGTPPKVPEAHSGRGRRDRARARNPRGAPKAAPAARDANADGKAAGDVETFDIRGRITNVNGRWLTVYARNTYFKPALKIELAEKPEISLDMNTYTLARPGDKISARGVQIGPQAAQATRVEIQLLEPLGKSSKPERPTAKRASRRPPKASGDREPFAVGEELEQGKPDPKEQKKESPP